MEPDAGEEMSIRTLRTLAPATDDGDGADWQPAALASRVVRCFDAVQLAWTRRDGQGLAPYVSDAMRARIDRWFDGFEGLSQVNRVENLELEHTTLTRIEFGDSAEEDRLVAEVAFIAHDWLEDLRTGAVLDGQAAAATRFEQRWTFVHDPERGWVVDTVDQQHPQGAPSPPAPRRGHAPPTTEPGRRTAVIGPPLPPPVPLTSSPGEQRWGSEPPRGAPRERPAARRTTGGAPRVLLLLLLCVALVAGAARAGLSLGTSSVADRAAAERARAQGRQTIAGPAFRRAFDEAQAEAARPDWCGVARRAAPGAPARAAGPAGPRASAGPRPERQPRPRQLPRHAPGPPLPQPRVPRARRRPAGRDRPASPPRWVASFA